MKRKLMITSGDNQGADTPGLRSDNPGKDPVYDVRRFLADAPPLKTILFSYEAVRVGKDQRDPVESTHLAEAAWQPNTFFVRLDPQDQQVVGRTLQGELWYVDKTKPAGQFVVSVNEADPAYRRSFAGSRATTFSRFLDQARSLWIHVLVPGTLRWLDDHRFEGKSNFPMPDTSAQGKVSGDIAAFDDQGRIAKISYRWDGMPTGASCWVEYQYETTVAGTRLPNIAIQASRASHLGVSHVERRTNYLMRVEIGTVDAGEKGFEPDQFANTTKSMPSTFRVVSSNGGKLCIGSRPPDPAQPEPNRILFDGEREKPEMDCIRRASGHGSLLGRSAPVSRAAQIKLWFTYWLVPLPVGDLKLPLRTHLTRFSSTDGSVLVEYDFRITHLSKECALQSFTPVLLADTIIADFRFSHGQAYVPPVAYGPVRGAWPSEQDSKSKPGYKATQENWERIQQLSQARRSEAQRPRTIARLVPVLSALAAPLWLTVSYLLRARARKVKLCQPYS